jgi:hypothetical protein
VTRKGSISGNSKAKSLLATPIRNIFSEIEFYPMANSFAALVKLSQYRKVRNLVRSF